MFNVTDLGKIRQIATINRMKLEEKYGKHRDAMMGKCIEASDTLVTMLNMAGFSAKAKQVWVLYQNFESCSIYCYEEHLIVEVIKGNEKVYIDTTLDQFQWAFDIALPRKWISDKLASFMLPRKPGRVTLKKCGWTDWYNTGDYYNEFEYRL